MSTTVPKSKLAIDGGIPVRPALLPYGHQCIDDDDVAAVRDALRSDWLTTGPKVAEFEKLFGSAVNAKHAVAVSNGTAALHAAISAVGITSGDEVITTPMTFAASANCVRYQGGTVVFADVREDTLNLDPEAVAAKITDRTKAIVTVDFAGLPSDLDEIDKLARRHGLTVIEDAAHSLGAVYRGRPVGSLFALTTFSLHPVKHITTGEGGMITTDSDRLANSLRTFRNHGITVDARQRELQGSWYYEIDELGYNYRLTDIQSALGISQLRKLPRWLERRRSIAKAYTEAFADVPELETPVVCGDRESAWHLYVIRLNLERLSVGREQIFRALRAENIGVNVHYIPVPWHPYYQRLGYRKGEWPVAEKAYERLISLPMWAAMTDSDVSDTVSAVRKVLTNYRQ
jgi:perosamine synthetase